MKYLLLSILAFFAYGMVSTVSAAPAEWVMCTLDYEPVCAQVQVQCLRAPCYPTYQTYSNQCMMSADTLAKQVHTGACTPFEEGAPVVLSEKLKQSLQTQFDKFSQSLATLSKTGQLAKFQQLDARITGRLAVTPAFPVDLATEIKMDRVRYALRFIQDLTKTSIWNLEESITGKRYLFRDPVKCEGIKIKCSDGESFFSDEIWCGCKK